MFALPIGQGELYLYEVIDEIDIRRDLVYHNNSNNIISYFTSNWSLTIYSWSLSSLTVWVGLNCGIAFWAVLGLGEAHEIRHGHRVIQ